jgi:hypothetical protein
VDFLGDLAVWGYGPWRKISRSITLPPPGHETPLIAAEQAMAVALAYPDPEKGGRGRKSFLGKEFSDGMLSKARTVLRDRDEQRRRSDAKGGGGCLGDARIGREDAEAR